MNRIQLSKNFFLDEYIPKELYLKFELKPAILIGLIDSRLVKSDQMLRNQFGYITINNWWSGGVRNYSGLRLPASPDYSPTSQHTFGRASDKLCEVPAEVVRQYIIANYLKLGITCIESNVIWVHSDCRQTLLRSLLTV
jgi:hypothetical protein